MNWFSSSASTPSRTPGEDDWDWFHDEEDFDVEVVPRVSREDLSRLEDALDSEFVMDVMFAIEPDADTLMARFHKVMIQALWWCWNDMGMRPL